MVPLFLPAREVICCGFLKTETEKLAIQDSLCTDTQLQFTATNVTCKGLTVARKRPIIHGDRKSILLAIGRICRCTCADDASTASAWAARLTKEQKL